MNRKPEALIFDFDGVVADTEPLYWEAWAVILAMYGIDFSCAEYCRIGRGVEDERMLRAIPELAANPALLEKLRQERPARKVMVEEFWREKLPIGEATIELLHSLRGYPLGLVTSSRRAAVVPMLETARIADCFTEAVFGDDTIPRKPDPAPYLLIRERLAVLSGVAFEDSDAGVESASQAGYEVLRVPAPQALPEIVRTRLGLSASSSEPFQRKPSPAPSSSVCRSRGTRRTLPGANRS
jgi:HAD superfamily hydrolase (TIGR01509 family)